MRANDMKAGGQGAPLVPAYHAALARSLPPERAGSFPMVFVNIGGISNITYVGESGDPIAFDTGPGNALIDQWVAREGGVPFDADGAIASEGGVVRRSGRALSRQSVLCKERTEIARPQRLHAGRGRRSGTRRRRAHAGCGIGRGDPEVGRAPAADRRSCGSSAAAAARTRISSAICVKARRRLAPRSSWPKTPGCAATSSRRRPGPIWPCAR